MKTKRKISGYFFKVNGETLSFEDLSDEQQDEILNGRSVEWLKSMVKGLAGVINMIGDQFDIYGYEEE